MNEGHVEALSKTIDLLLLVRRDLAEGLTPPIALLDQAIDCSKSAEVLCINLKYKKG